MPRTTTTTTKKKTAGAPTFFASGEEFRRWLERHHATATELVVGFHKRATGKPSMTWSESVDEALCYGWIDGVRHSLGPDAYTIRFTPRRKGSIWSAINLRKVEELTRSGRMRPAGRRAYEERDPRKAQRYSFEQETASSFTPAQEAAFRRNRAAWRFWEAQPPGYRRVATFWVTSAKREETRARRLATLIADSAAGQRVGVLRRRDGG